MPVISTRSRKSYFMGGNCSIAPRSSGKRGVKPRSVNCSTCVLRNNSGTEIRPFRKRQRIFISFLSDNMIFIIGFGKAGIFGGSGISGRVGSGSGGRSGKSKLISGRSGKSGI